MAVAIGTRLGRYEIRSQLGVGGQGAVYKALDTKLGRTVVVKILPPELTAKEVNLKRFEREARLASALDHPNICTIFDLNEEGGVHFIAMQHVEGRNVRQLVKGRPLELPSALSIAIQVADALAAAHAHGIVHRDIKAGNVMVTDDGTAKVLDFGLAKLLDEGGADDAHLTEIGKPYGTATYAAPEQSRGLPVDHRADIFSAGVLLYEMLTGTWPFHGKTSLDVRLAVLQEKPKPLAEARREPVPPRLQEILDRALAKDPQDRYQKIAELRDDLKSVLREVSAGGDDIHLTRGAAPVAPRHAATGPLARMLRRLRGGGAGATSTGGSGRAAETLTGQASATGEAQGIHTTSSAEYLVTEIKRHRRVVAAVLAALVVALAGGAYGLYKLFGPGRVAPFQTINVTRLTTTGKATDVALSPDGKYIVYVMSEAGRQSLWVRRVAVAGSNVRIVEPAEAAYRGLTFSPDGEFVFYVRGDGNSPLNSLYQVPVLGGQSRKLLDEVDSPVTFSPDGARFAFVRRRPTEGEAALMIAKADGSGAQKIAARQLPDFFSYPAWSPDGKTIACSVTGYTGGFHGSVVEVSADQGTEKPVSTRRWASIERLAWLADGSGVVLIAQDDPANPVQIWSLSYPGGEARAITRDLNNYFGVSLTADSNALATVQSDMDINVWTAGGGIRQVTSAPSGFNDYWGVSWTPDGKIIYSSTASGNQDVWVMEADGSNQRQLTDDPRQDFDPSMSPDGRFVVFTSLREGAANIWRMDADGRNPVRLTAGKRDFVPSVSPDGRWVIYTNGDAEWLTIWKVPIGGGPPVQLTERPANWPAISPDGKLIACWYTDAASKLQKLAVIPFEGGPPVKTFDVAPTVTTWAEVRWIDGGRSLAHIDTHNGVSEIWSQPLDGGAPQKLTDFKADQIFRFDWSRDGKGLVCTRGKVISDVVLISNTR